MSLQRTIITQLALITALASCKFNSERPEQSSEVKFLNEHSRRRVASAEESTNIFRLKTYGGNTCTAFAVKNEAKKPIVFTARHCMNFTASDWCSKVSEITSADQKNSYRCKSVLFDPKDSDYAALELDRPIPSQGFLLANFDPALGRRLQLIGFPSDWYAKSLEGTVLTENCWLTSSKRELPNIQSQITPRPLALMHNCATYGGNSGGPMIIENSNIVVGLPATYWRSAQIRSMDENAFVYPTKDLIDKHRSFIDSEKILLAGQDSNAAVKKDFLSRSKCSSATMKTEIEELVPIYNSETDFTALKVKFKGYNWLLFRCKDDNSCDERTNNSGEVIKIKSNTEITYTKKDVTAEFRCESF